MGDAGMIEKTHKSTDGLSLFYRDYPSATSVKVPVLCLPGLTRNSLDFADLAPRLAKTRRVICPDFRGRGLSDYDPNYANYQPTAYVGDVIALIEHLGLDRVVLIGTSLGGLVSQGVVAASPGLVAGVVLNDIGPELHPVGLKRIQSYVGRGAEIKNWEDAGREVKRLNGEAHPARPDAFWAEYAYKVCNENESGVPQFAYDLKIGDAAREAPAAPPEALWALYGLLKDTPTLAIRGEISDLLSQECFAKMQALKPDLVQATVSGVGHAPMLDEPEAVNAIEEFLSKVD